MCRRIRQPSATCSICSSSSICNLMSLRARPATAAGLFLFAATLFSKEPADIVDLADKRPRLRIAANVRNGCRGHNPLVAIFLTGAETRITESAECAIRMTMWRSSVLTARPVKLDVPGRIPSAHRGVRRSSTNLAHVRPSLFLLRVSRAATSCPQSCTRTYGPSPALSRVRIAPG
jgi:hypothetical protein